jgi:hypothetical protein
MRIRRNSKLLIGSVRLMVPLYACLADIFRSPGSDQLPRIVGLVGLTEKMIGAI